MSNRTLRNGVHIDPRRPWSRGTFCECWDDIVSPDMCSYPKCQAADRKFGWDAIYGPGESGAPVDGSGVENRRHASRSLTPQYAGRCKDPRARDMGRKGHSRSSDRPTVLPSVLSEGLNVVVAACLVAGVLLAAGVAHMEAPDRQVKVYTERME